MYILLVVFPRNMELGPILLSRRFHTGLCVSKECAKAVNTSTYGCLNHLIRFSGMIQNQY